jgi:hypothetical protein
VQTQLQSVVYASGNAWVFSYTIKNLGNGVTPGPDNLGRLQALRQQLINDLVQRSWSTPAFYARQRILTQQRLIQQKQLQRRQQLQFREQLGELLRAKHDRKEFLDGLFQEMVRQSPEELKSRLEDNEADIRLVAVQAVADRRLHFEETLIDLLNDSSSEVQQAAHQALVRLSRGNDFGPAPSGRPADRARAIRSWLGWLLWQDIPGQPSPHWLAQKLRDGPSDIQEWLLGQLRDWTRGDATSVLARTIPLLAPTSEPARDSQEAQPKASAKAKAEGSAETTPAEQLRGVLAGRLSKLSATALEHSLKDGDAEIRRAATAACALRNDKAHVPALAATLKDREPAVSQAAHAALRELTGQDLGPPPGADAARIESAVAAWLRWWQGQPQAGSKSPRP